jgi:hypothetical protein
MSIEWAESEGGPLVLLEVGLVGSWSGYRGDYEAACEVTGYVGRIALEEGSGSAIIIGDEPLPAAFIPDLPAIVQCVYASEKEILISGARSLIGDVSDWELGPEFETRGELKLFDAALPGVESPGESIPIVLGVGLYRVDTADVEIDPENCVRIHRLTSIFPLG